MLIPAAPGTWPAFWMLPSDNLAAPTPSVAEIDALEAYGVHPLDACHSTHQYTSGNEDAGVSRCGQRFTSDRDALSWHTYGVSITPTDITYYIDGRVVATAPQVHGGGSPMFFMVNLALGGGWPIDSHPSRTAQRSTSTTCAYTSDRSLSSAAEVDSGDHSRGDVKRTRIALLPKRGRASSARPVASTCRAENDRVLGPFPVGPDWRGPAVAPVGACAALP